MENNKTYDPTTELPPGIGAPAVRALTQAGLTSLHQLAEVTETYLKNLHGIGPNAINLIRVELSKEAMSFAGGNSG